jgi:hypothetical protein
VVAVPVAVPVRESVIPGIHTSVKSFCSSPSVSIHTVPVIAPTDATVIGAAVVVVVGAGAVVVVDGVVVVVTACGTTAAGVVNERITPSAEPFVLVIDTRK